MNNVQIAVLYDDSSDGKVLRRCTQWYNPRFKKFHESIAITVSCSTVPDFVCTMFGQPTAKPEIRWFAGGVHSSERPNHEDRGHTDGIKPDQL